MSGSRTTPERAAKHAAALAKRQRGLDKQSAALQLQAALLEHRRGNHETAAALAMEGHIILKRLATAISMSIEEIKQQPLFE